MFNLPKNINAVFEVFPAETGVLLQLKIKKNKKISLPLDKETALDFSRWEPEIAKALYGLESAIKEIVQIEIENSHSHVGFTEEQMLEKNCRYSEGGILLSYKLIGAIRFGDGTESSGLKERDLASLNIPAYAKLRLSLESEGLYKDPNFKFNLNLKGQDGERIKIISLLGHHIIDTGGKKYFLNPLVFSLINKIENHKKLRKTSEFKNNQSVRIKNFSEIRELALQVKARIDNFVKSEDVLYLEELPYEIARDLDGELVAAPRLPIEHKNNDQEFERVLAKSDTLESGDYLNLKSRKGSNQTVKRVFLSDEARENITKVQNFNSSSRKAKEEWAENLENYFGHSPREVIGTSFSERVSGFIIGKIKTNRSDTGSDSDWGKGFEEESTILRTMDNSTIKISYNPLPEEYESIKRLIPDIRDKEVQNEVEMRRETGAHLTPLPRKEQEGIFVEALNAMINLTELERFSKQVEGSYNIQIDDDQIEEAKSKIREAERSNRFLTKWDLGEDQESSVPIASLRKAIPKESKKAEERVSLAVLGRTNLLGIPPDWRWEDSKENEHVRAPGFKQNIELWPHQRKGYAWLKWIFGHSIRDNSSQHRGALIADDMGLGKTIQVIALISHVRSLSLLTKKPILIIAPLGLIRTSWLKDGFAAFLEPGILNLTHNNSFGDIANFADCPYKPDLKLSKDEAKRINSELRNDKKEIDRCSIDTLIKEELKRVQEWCGSKIIITSYETARNRGIALASIDFSLVILDEAQKIKNAGTLQSNSIKALKGDMFIAMTGTPIENSLMDLWGIMDFVLPDHLGDQATFRKNFVTKVKNAPPGSDDRERARNELENALAPVWMRRTKSEIYRDSPDLPDIIHHDSVQLENGDLKNEHEVVMSESQEIIYSQFANTYGNGGTGGIVALGGMLDACSAPWLATDSRVVWKNRDELFKISQKLKILIFDILEKIRGNSEADGQKVILFANKKAIQRDLAYFIFDWNRNTSDEKIEVEVYNGDVPDNARENMLARFKTAPGFAVIIISPRAGGVGLNLTEANHVIHYTREWNPALERQATDRAYRLKQKRDVHVYYPTTIGRELERPSAEQHLAELLRSKRGLMEDFTISSSESKLEEQLNASLKSTSKDKDVLITPQTLRLIGHKEFESYIACLYEKTQNLETYVVGKPGDGGADVLCIGQSLNLLIQVKHTQQGNEAGTKALQEVRGARSLYEEVTGRTCNLIAATNSRFSIEAVNLSLLGDSVELVNFSKICEMAEGIEILKSEVLDKIKQRPPFEVP